MKDFRVDPFYFLIIILVVFAIACGDDDEAVDNDPTTEEMLVGTWTTSSVEVTAEVDGQSLIDYLVNDLGYSEGDAALFNALFEAGLEESVTGSITLNSDNTYDSNFDGDTDDGTWSLSADESMITLDAGTADEATLNINSLTSTTLIVSLEDVISEDLDDDPETDDEEIMVEAVVTLSK